VGAGISAALANSVVRLSKKWPAGNSVKLPPDAEQPVAASSAAAIQHGAT
jgi:hypothetical protein